MKSLNKYIEEKLIVNKNYDPYRYHPKTGDELKEIVEQQLISSEETDLNCIDTSNIDDFSEIFWNNDIITNIDVSEWDVSKGKHFDRLFCNCCNLEKIIGIENWDVRNAVDFNNMFYNCKKFNQDLSQWDVRNVEHFEYMFYDCKNFNCDLSQWDVSSGKIFARMFQGCPIKQEFKPKHSDIK